MRFQRLEINDRREPHERCRCQRQRVYVIVHLFDEGFLFAQQKEPLHPASEDRLQLRLVGVTLTRSSYKRQKRHTVLHSVTNNLTFFILNVQTQTLDSTGVVQRAISSLTFLTWLPALSEDYLWVMWAIFEEIALIKAMQRRNFKGYPCLTRALKNKTKSFKI